MVNLVIHGVVRGNVICWWFYGNRNVSMTLFDLVGYKIGYVIWYTRGLAYCMMFHVMVYKGISSLFAGGWLLQDGGCVYSHANCLWFGTDTTATAWEKLIASVLVLLLLLQFGWNLGVQKTGICQSNIDGGYNGRSELYLLQPKLLIGCCLVAKHRTGCNSRLLTGNEGLYLGVFLIMSVWLFQVIARDCLYKVCYQ